MALTRVWTPSGNYSSGSTKRLIVVHTMEGFTGSNGAYDCAKYFQGNVGASSQVCIDNNRGVVWEGVSRHNGSWTQCGFNSVSVSCEQSGYASWSRDYWLNNRSNQLHNIADWIAEESKHLGIPITDLTASQAQGGSWGVCYHSELGSTGCGHSDPGSGWPADIVLEWARGGSSAPPEGSSVDMSTVAIAEWNGQKYYAALNLQGQVWFKQPDTDWFRVDNEQTGAKSGCGLLIIKGGDDDGEATISYTNGNSAACTYTRPPGGGKFGWASLSPNNWFR